MSSQVFDREKSAKVKEQSFLDRDQELVKRERQLTQDISAFEDYKAKIETELGEKRQSVTLSLRELSESRIQASELKAEYDEKLKKLRAAGVM
jgi:predicted phage-related endonuclease